MASDGWRIPICSGGVEKGADTNLCLTWCFFGEYYVEKERNLGRKSVTVNDWVNIPTHAAHVHQGTR